MNGNREMNMLGRLLLEIFSVGTSVATVVCFVFFSGNKGTNSKRNIIIFGLPRTVDIIKTVYGLVSHFFVVIVFITPDGMIAD